MAPVADLPASPPPSIGHSPVPCDSTEAADPANPATVSPTASSSAGFLSAPTLPSYPSPLRQHRRTPSQHREVKETLNAVSEFADDEDNGITHHRINQYVIKAMIGKGSYGAVHIAIDQYGQEFAIKEFSKARLRKRARTNIMKQGPFRMPRFPGAAWPDGLQSSPSAKLNRQRQAEAQDALYLIREEIAVMKKISHPNLVGLIEVLDDPDQDSLYMVLEMCNKGVIMDVGLGKTARPYDSEACRCWFRDLILGIEYLHEQNIIHRDIKPDNLLITADDVLKIGDFGVSEIFAKPDEMRTNKTAGSPAFLPPELCISNHGDVFGPACDIWSMGVTLYCLRYGKIPFERESMPDIYDAINNSTPNFPDNEDDVFLDLMRRILEKDPSKRIKMPELRDHPWVTLNGADPLLSNEENCAHPVEPPTALDLNHAITQRMGHLLCVLKAIAKFKSLLQQSRSRKSTADATVVTLSESAAGAPVSQTSRNQDAVMVTSAEVVRVVEERRNNLRRASGAASGAAREKGTDMSSRSPTLVLGIGTGGREDEFGLPEDDGDGPDADAPGGVVSESPTAADFDVYDHAFQAEVARIQAQSSNGSPIVYLTRVLEQKLGSAEARSRYLEGPGSRNGKNGGGRSENASSDVPGRTASR